MKATELNYSTAYNVLNKAQSSALKVLLYFDIFNYALTAEEIHAYSVHNGPLETHNTLANLVQSDMIATLHGKYFLPGRQENIKQREELNKRAVEFYGKANSYTKLISNFPFVRGVLVTGSLSKGCMEKNGDIDYLIITSPDRLWLCRTFLTAYKKTVLFNSRKYFCVNYYLDEESLQIPDHNVFTATEVTSAKPGYNLAVCEKFFSDNQWTLDFYPNMKQDNFLTVHEEKKSFIQSALEALFDGKLGDIADGWLMRLFVWRWKNKFKGEDKHRFEVNFRSRKNVSKHHPQGFQFKVLSNYQQSLKNFEEKFNVRLS